MFIWEIGDFAALVSFFALLLLASGFAFHVSKNTLIRHRMRARFFLLISTIGATTSAVGLLLTWRGLFFAQPADSIDSIVVFVPGSIAAPGIITLTADNSGD